MTSPGEHGLSPVVENEGTIDIAAGATLTSTSRQFTNSGTITGGGTFRDFGVLQKGTATGVSDWDVCYVAESGSSIVEQTGSFHLTGSCG